MSVLLVFVFSSGFLTLLPRLWNSFLSLFAHRQAVWGLKVAGNVAINPWRHVDFPSV